MWKQIRKIMTRFRPELGVRDRVSIWKPIALSFAHELQLLAMLWGTWDSCGWQSHHRWPSPDVHGSEGSTFRLWELTCSVTSCKSLLTWLHRSRPQPELRMSLFTEILGFTRDVLLAWHSPTACAFRYSKPSRLPAVNAHLTTSQISREPGDQQPGCPAPQSSAGNGRVRDYKHCHRGEENSGTDTHMYQ